MTENPIEKKDFEAYVQEILAGHGHRSLPPVEKWNPPLSGDIDIVIQRSGSWFHEGEEIERQKLVTLFSTILKREGDDYFLVTPVEKWRITVEDVPFTVTAMEIGAVSGQQVITFVTSTSDQVVLSNKNPLRVVTDPATEEPSPYVMVRNGMEGRLNRSTFYQLVDHAELLESNGQECYQVSSDGESFRLC